MSQARAKIDPSTRQFRNTGAAAYFALRSRSRSRSRSRPRLPPDRTNPNGSGASLGHPVAATGAILTVKSLYELQRTGGRYALVTMCIGGGQGIAAIFERV